MDWSKGQKIIYRMMLMDPVTWRDTQEVEMIKGNMSRTNENLRQSADITVSSFERECEKYVRVWLETEQDGAASRDALFTGIANAPDESIGASTKEVNLNCYSVLKPAEGIPLQRGWYAPAGMPGGDVIRNLLAVTKAPLEIAENSPTLQDYIIAEDDENHLTMTDKVLGAIGWRMRITGLGKIVVGPPAEKPSAIFGEEFDVIKAPVVPSDNWFGMPNVFQAISGDMSATARDDSEDSVLSTVNRGREIWMTESDCLLNDGESLEQYSRRRLKEEQKKAGKMEYDRRFHPDVLPSDLVQLHYPEFGLNGLVYVNSQDMEFSTELNVSEEVSVWV